MARTKSTLLRAKSDFERINDLFGVFQKNCSSEFQEINKKHPQLLDTISALKGLFVSIKDLDTMSEAAIRELIQNYNLLAFKINALITEINRVNTDPIQNPVLQVEQTISKTEPEQEDINKEELENFAKMLWQEFFPESNTDKFVMWITNQKELAGYQKILMAPANGIEDVVAGVIKMLNVKTYKDLASSIKTIYGMDYEEWCVMWKGLKYAYEKASDADKIAVLISTITSLAVMAGGINKVIAIAEKTGHSAAFAKLASGGRIFPAATNGGDLARKSVPLVALLGCSLPYVDLGQRVQSAKQETMMRLQTLKRSLKT